MTQRYSDNYMTCDLSDYHIKNTLGTVAHCGLWHGDRDCPFPGLWFESVVVVGHVSNQEVVSLSLLFNMGWLYK